MTIRSPVQYKIKQKIFLRKPKTKSLLVKRSLNKTKRGREMEVQWGLLSFLFLVESDDHSRWGSDESVFYKVKSRVPRCGLCVPMLRQVLSDVHRPYSCRQYKRP